MIAHGTLVRRSRSRAAAAALSAGVLVLLAGCEGTAPSSVAAPTSSAPPVVVAAPAVNGLAVEQEVEAAAAVEAARVAAEAEAARVAAEAEAARLAAEAAAQQAAQETASRGSSTGATAAQRPASAPAPAGYTEWLRLENKSCAIPPEAWRVPDKPYELSFTAVYSDGVSFTYTTVAFPSPVVTSVWWTRDWVERQWPVTPETQHFDC